MKIDKNGHIYIPCEICGKDERHGPHLYNGHHLRLYGGIFCCDSCWDNNWDGWTHSLEPKLLEILQKKGLPTPERNDKNLLPRD